MEPLYERYRPRNLDEVVGQPKAVRKIRLLAERGLGGHAYWVCGPSGTGKTTLARIIAGFVANPMATVELDAGELHPRRLEEMRATLYLAGMGAPGGRAYIVNEAQGLHTGMIRQLLTALEPIAPRGLWVFTTTKAGQESLGEDHEDAGPLLSRCIRIELETEELAGPFARFARTVAEAEGLNAQPLEEYIRLAERCQCNLRAMLQAVESGEMVGDGT